MSVSQVVWESAPDEYVCDFGRLLTATLFLHERFMYSRDDIK